MDGAHLTCRIAWMTIQPHASYRMTATIGESPAIEAQASDLFETLCLIRRQLEDQGVRLCCAGARRDVWPSGMQRDMGQGLVAYVLTLPRVTERPATVRIFEPAARDVVATVDEQREFAQSWMAQGRGDH